MRKPRSVAPGATAPALSLRLAVLALALAPLALAPTDGSAQRIPSPYRFIETRQEVGIFVGQVEPSRGDLDFGPGSGTAFGARYAIHLGGPFSLEGALTALPATRHVIDPEATGNRIIGEADVLLASVDARVRFNVMGHRTWRGLSPYVLVGGGGILDLAGDQEADLALPLDQRFTFDASFLGTLGTGVQWLPGDRLAFRADLLLNLWRLNTPPGYAILEDVLGPVEQSQWVRATAITVGAGIRF